MLASQPGVISLAKKVALGVVGVISPFNFPLYLAMRAVAPALGNAVVLKPDPRTSVRGGFAIAGAFEKAGLPSGILHVLPGDGDSETGSAMCILTVKRLPSNAFLRLLELFWKTTEAEAERPGKL